MEINLNSNGLNGLGNFGIGNDAAGIEKTGAAREAVGTSRATAASVNMSAAQNVDGLFGAEPVADVPDAALTRDDALGKAVKAAFNLPPPPMPAFTD